MLECRNAGLKFGFVFKADETNFTIFPEFPHVFSYMGRRFSDDSSILVSGGRVV
jgi:hypothetical protein